MDMETYDELVESIYDAPFKESGWQEVVSKILKAFNSTAAGFFVQTRDNGLGNYCFDGIDDSQMKLYEDHYASVNPWFSTPNLMRPGEVHTDYSLERLSNDRNAFVDSEFYQDWCKPQEMRHAMGGSLLDFDGNLLNITFHRPSLAGYYTKREIFIYKQLSRHLLKAVQLGEKLDQITTRNTVLDDVLDQLRLGILFLDKRGHIFNINSYAQRLIQQNDELFEKSAKFDLSEKKYRNELRAQSPMLRLRGNLRHSPCLDKHDPRSLSASFHLGKVGRYCNSVRVM